jgi:hypothetical protein
MQTLLPNINEIDRKPTILVPLRHQPTSAAHQDEDLLSSATTAEERHLLEEAPQDGEHHTNVESQSIVRSDLTISSSGKNDIPVEHNDINNKGTSERRAVEQDVESTLLISDAIHENGSSIQGRNSNNAVYCEFILLTLELQLYYYG